MTGEVISGLVFVGHSVVTSVVLSQDGKHMASGSSGIWTSVIWFGPFRRHTDGITSIAFSPALGPSKDSCVGSVVFLYVGKRTASGSSDGTI